MVTRAQRHGRLRNFTKHARIMQGTSVNVFPIIAMPILNITL